MAHEPKTIPDEIADMLLWAANAEPAKAFENLEDYKRWAREVNVVEPKIVTELDCGEVAAYEIRSGIGITFLAPAAQSVRYTATFDRANAKALRDALTAVLDKDGG